VQEGLGCDTFPVRHDLAFRLLLSLDEGLEKVRVAAVLSLLDAVLIRILAQREEYRQKIV